MALLVEARAKLHPPPSLVQQVVLLVMGLLVGLSIWCSASTSYTHSNCLLTCHATTKRKRLGLCYAQFVCDVMSRDWPCIIGVQLLLLCVVLVCAWLVIFVLQCVVISKWWLLLL